MQNTKIPPTGWEFSGPAMIKHPFSIITKNKRLLLKFLGYTVSNIRNIDRRSLDIILASELDAREYWEDNGSYLPLSNEKRYTLAQTLRDHVIQKSQRKPRNRGARFNLSNRM